MLLLQQYDSPTANYENMLHYDLFHTYAIKDTGLSLSFRFCVRFIMLYYIDSIATVCRLAASIMLCFTFIINLVNHCVLYSTTLTVLEVIDAYYHYYYMVVDAR